jgi:hypothetical protein
MLALSCTYSWPFCPLQVGLPYLGALGLEFGATQSFTTTNTETADQMSTYTTKIQQQVPGRTLQVVYAEARADTIITKVPVTITNYYTCNKTTTINNTAIITTKGTVYTTSATVQVTYGPEYPLDAPDVFGSANATCVSNPTCSAIFLREGNCCPTDSGKYLPCCSFCVLRQACSKLAVDNTTMCCPTSTGQWLTCCGQKPY